jgi:hypothetical protein
MNSREYIAKLEKENPFEEEPTDKPWEPGLDYPGNLGSNLQGSF